jgi:hypothetical protein
MHFINQPNRCLLFEEISNLVWNRIIRNHLTGNDAREIGFTSDIVSDIEYNRLLNPNIGIYAKEAQREHITGNDIDIFVESKPGYFVWWALQAKVLHIDGTYHDVAVLRSGNEYQWDKLERLSKSSGCLTDYLFYNGLNGFRYLGTDQCGRIFNEEQFGCSLVSVEEVKKKALLGKVGFKDFHTQIAQPWRIITCCLQRKDVINYSKLQVLESVKDYTFTVGNKDVLSDSLVNIDANEYSINSINEFSNLAERFPEFRFVIRTSESLKKYQI